jgi:hypothetical protein
MQKQNKKKSKKGEKTNKMCKTKWGLIWSLGFFYKPLDLGLEAIVSSQSLFAFFPFKLKPWPFKTLFSFFSQANILTPSLLVNWDIQIWERI